MINERTGRCNYGGEPRRRGLRGYECRSFSGDGALCHGFPQGTPEVRSIINRKTERPALRSQALTKKALKTEDVLRSVVEC